MRITGLGRACEKPDKQHEEDGGSTASPSLHCFLRQGTSQLVFFSQPKGAAEQTRCPCVSQELRVVRPGTPLYTHPRCTSVPNVPGEPSLSCMMGLATNVPWTSSYQDLCPAQHTYQALLALCPSQQWVWHVGGDRQHRGRPGRKQEACLPKHGLISLVKELFPPVPSHQVHPLHQKASGDGRSATWLLRSLPRSSLRRVILDKHGAPVCKHFPWAPVAMVPN